MLSLFQTFVCIAWYALVGPIRLKQGREGRKEGRKEGRREGGREGRRKEGKKGGRKE